MKSVRRCKNRNTTLLSLFMFLLFLYEPHSIPTLAEAKRNVYIVYMGKGQRHDPKLLLETHLEILTGVLGSKEASAEAMVYSYKHGFTGFAAKLTGTQAQIISELPTVVQVIPNRFYKLQTTRSWDYLQLDSYSPKNILHKSQMGDGVIIGVLDTGIWPESEVFRDEGLGPIPSRWKGACESGEQFDARKTCNRKLIGARYFIKGLHAEYGKPFNITEYQDYLSPRDSIGHGTHTSATAGGFFKANVSYNGLGFGTVRGGAPLARLALYKVCWKLYEEGICASVDILKAFDKAIHDGVDVISLSIAPSLPLFSDIDTYNGISVGAFHAAENGITVVCAAGNVGPSALTIENTAPWVITVAASTIDRSFPTRISLGNNWTTMGQAMFTGRGTGFTNLVYPEVAELLTPRYCESLSPNDTWSAGHVVLCFTSGSNQSVVEDAAWSVKEIGCLGLIIAEKPKNSLYSCDDNFPCVRVSYDIGMQILNYIRSTRNPQVMIRPSKTHVGRPVSTRVAYFSSRGPGSVAPAILKPDVAAPGVNILAAVPPSSPGIAFEFQSGTSMATPHVSGIVALLKSLHSDWSPAVIKSAIVTTAWTTDPYGEPIYAEGEPMKLADAFDYGGGIVNGNRAADPGLVYDMGTTDYIQYLCAMGYKNSDISQVTGNPAFCPMKQPSILNLNFPSITIPTLRNSTTITRTVTNVGAVYSRYVALVEPPLGISIAVKPDILIFNSIIKAISFTVTVSSSHKVTTGYSFGSLTWSDGVHSVRSPISVRTEMIESYD
ncbi:subtilisin-like protease SBT3.6 isoform X1 [Juglans microcarpa x Juglans regia]|uniref:subtilisin-like protease SBT3.6 isoform X1 n=1 Tax=Juglans microcarpa x Juglans regia TaxID=2249226 RepID=UPI001B7F59D2|nr:subtilisin-like protease SBT3.6 isoform X1 [Juglans microcarpa x Juglans regia]